MLFRSLRTDETDLLKIFLYEAIFIPEGVEPPEREIIYQPELALYYEAFGSGAADNCIVAEDDGMVVGAVWTRIMNDYGHVDDETPSFHPEAKGIKAAKITYCNDYIKSLIMCLCMRTTTLYKMGERISDETG